MEEGGFSSVVRISNVSDFIAPSQVFFLHPKYWILFFMKYNHIHLSKRSFHFDSIFFSVLDCISRFFFLIF